MTLAQTADRTIWMPMQASTKAAGVDWLFYFITYIALAFFVLIVVLMVYFCWKYRRRPGNVPSQITHNTPLELAWSILPSILLVFMFWYGFVGYLDARTPPASALEIKVNAQQWAWEFVYPGGVTSDELHLPVNTPVQFVMNSADVLHSFFVPAFRVKMDLVPGRYTKLWVEPNRVGEYLLLCAEYCGTKHSDMRAKVVVHEPGGFEKWRENADPISQMDEAQYKAFNADPQKFIDQNPQFSGLKVPRLMGEKLYASKGCKQCHSVDGVVGQGPSWKGIWGAQHKMRDGSIVTVDENYVRESILNPGAKIVEGFSNIMTPYQGRIKDREIDMLIEYMKTLK